MCPPCGRSDFGSRPHDGDRRRPHAGAASRGRPRRRTVADRGRRRHGKDPGPGRALPAPSAGGRAGGTDPAPDLHGKGGARSARPGRAGGLPARRRAIRPHLSRLRPALSPGGGLAVRNPQRVSHRLRGTKVGTHARCPAGAKAAPPLPCPAALRAHRRVAQIGRTSQAGVGLSGGVPGVGRG